MSYLPTEEQRTAWAEWVASRPPRIRVVAEKMPPWHDYRLVATGQRAQLYSFGEMEDGTVGITANVWREELPIPPHGVFGLKPEDLEPLPHDDVKPSEWRFDADTR